MNHYAVIDTNVLVSALLRLDSNPGKITIESLTGRIIPLLNEEILSEYRDKILMMEAHVFLLLSEFKKGEVPDWTSQPGLLG